MHNVLIFLLVNPALSACKRRSCCSRLSDWLRTGSIQFDKSWRKRQWRRCANGKTSEQNASIDERSVLSESAHHNSTYFTVMWLLIKCVHTIYTIICLKSVGVRKLQVAIIALSPREMSLTDRILPMYILSRVRVSVRPRIFFIREKTPNQSRPHVVYSMDPLCGQINNWIGNCRTDSAGWRRAKVSSY